METKIYNSKGKEAGKIKLPEDVFNVSWNADLVHQVVTSMMTNSRQPIAHAKTRAEVRGGGKKPWRQKGTGRARHGSTRSPIWVGGGVTHGPRNEKNYSRKVNKKVKTKALFSILSKKLKDNEIILIDSFGIEAPKTKEGISIIKALSAVKGFEKLSTKKTNAALVALSSKNVAVEKSLRNVSSVLVEDIRNINPVEILQSKFLILENPEESVKVLQSKNK